MVYNIHAGKDAAGVDNLERVAALIKANDADLVLLQEVDRNTTRSGRVDQLAELERLTGFHGVLGKSLDYQGGDYGIATLSRWPIKRHETVHLPVEPPQERAGGSHEPRVALVVETNGLTVLNTHLDASGTDHYRLQEVREVIAVLKPLVSSRLVAGGDFNSNPDSPVHDQMVSSGLRDSWLECGGGESLTYPASTPVKRIDYLYLGKPLRCSSATVLDTQASDHRPVLIVVE
jgi:endonuclease/exonuclease/phosphatase family metal-dependent hydrolase